MLSIFRGKRPDVTPAQVVAVMLAGIPILANLGAAFEVFTVTLPQQAALSEAVQWGGIFAGLLVGGDALVRAARNAGDSKVQVAALTPAPADAAQPDMPPDVLHAHEVELLNSGGDGVTDDEEFAAPPPDEETMPVQPSQVTGSGGLIG